MVLELASGVGGGHILGSSLVVAMFGFFKHFFFVHIFFFVLFPFIFFADPLRLRESFAITYFWYKYNSSGAFRRAKRAQRSTIGKKNLVNYPFEKIWL